MTGPKENSFEFCFPETIIVPPRLLLFPEAKPMGTLRVEWKVTVSREASH